MRSEDQRTYLDYLRRMMEKNIAVSPHKTQRGIRLEKKRDPEIVRLETMLTEAQAKIETLEKDKAQTHSVYLQKAQQMQHHAQQQKAAAEKLQAQMVQLTSDHAAAMDDLTAQMKAQAETVRSLEADKRLLTQQMSNETGTLRETLKSKEQELVMFEECLNEEREAHQRKVEALEKVVAEHSGTIAKLTAQVRHTEKTGASAAELQLEIERQHEQLQRMQEENASIIETLTGEKEELLRTVAELQEIHERHGKNVKSMAETHEQEVAELRQQIERQRKEIEQLRQDKKSAQKQLWDVNNLQTAIDEQKKVIQKLKKDTGQNLPEQKPVNPALEHSEKKPLKTDQQTEVNPGNQDHGTPRKRPSRKK